MSEIKTGGPAFPVAEVVIDGHVYAPDATGMNLRDYFAAKAMQSLIPNEYCDAENLSADSYAIADAMLKALELAAKAAGIDWWNPYGDALRLAVKLKIDMCFDNGGVEAIWINEDISDTHMFRENADEGMAAKEAATRRAIVRAAAEIGKEAK